MPRALSPQPHRATALGLSWDFCCHPHPRPSQKSPHRQHCVGLSSVTPAAVRCNAGGARRLLGPYVPGTWRQARRTPGAAQGPSPLRVLRAGREPCGGILPTRAETPETPSRLGFEPGPRGHPCHGGSGWGARGGMGMAAGGVGGSASQTLRSIASKTTQHRVRQEVPRCP